MIVWCCERAFEMFLLVSFLLSPAAHASILAPDYHGYVRASLSLVFATDLTTGLLFRA